LYGARDRPFMSQFGPPSIRFLIEAATHFSFRFLVSQCGNLTSAVAHLKIVGPG
jgi:hypothetical protein